MIGELPPDMEKYRALLNNQYELARIYNQEHYKYKLNKNREEKRRYREKLKDKKRNR